MMIGDGRDDHDAFLCYRFLRARAPEGLTAKSVTVVTIVIGKPVCCGGKKSKNVGGDFPRIQAGCNSRGCA
jgi:hypothetical protein